MKDTDPPTLTAVMVVFTILAVSLLTITMVTVRALQFYNLGEYTPLAAFTICGVAIYWGAMLILGKRFRP